MRIECFQAAGDHTGERPLWDAATGDFYWIDVFGQRIHRRSGDGTVRTWSVPSLIGSLALIDESRAIVSLHNGFFLFHFADGRCELVGFPDPGVAGNLRLNDGKVDPMGRFICGGADYFRSQPIAGLYQLNEQFQMNKVADDIIVSNGLAWSVDGRSIFYADSFRHTIYRASYDLATGAVGPRTEFARFSHDEGMPDGACIDADDHLWVAAVYGGKLVRFRPDGSREREVRMPVAAPTSVAFGGEKLDKLLVTSKSMDSRGHPLDPGSGGHVFMVEDVPAAGTAELRFRGRPA